MLQGLDKDWSSPTSKTEVNFGNLSQGDYTFRVKAMNPNGYWGPVYEYSFVVRPPWWQTWWFLTLASLISIGTIVFYIKRRELALKEKQRVLEKAVEERTIELVAEKKEVEKQKVVLEKEKQRSDDLLLNILPEEVAEELKNTGVATARNFSNVTILFTDFIGFTKISEKLDANELVDELDICFSKFDEIITFYDIEKIKTIGDSYMCAGGLSGHKKHSAVNVVSAGLEMQSFIINRRSERIAMGRPGFQMRLGIHTGPVISGVVGLKKFQYDIWGDSVNTAKRIESAGESGRVNISANTYELVKKQFECEHRTNIIIKDKGEMAMYFVNQRI
jgi:class 3 adenylate cyclase